MKAHMGNKYIVLSLTLGARQSKWFSATPWPPYLGNDAVPIAQ